MKRRSGKSNWPSGRGREAGWKRSNEKRSAERKQLREHAFNQCCTRISEKTSLEVLQRRALRKYNKLQKFAAVTESIVACDYEAPWTQPKNALGLSPGNASDQDIEQVILATEHVAQQASPSALSEAESMPESFKCVFQVWKTYFWSISGSDDSAPLLYDDPMAEFR